MSSPITTGLYRIRNAQYPDRFITMERNYEFSGGDNPQTFFVEVKNEVTRIVTIKVAISGLQSFLTLQPDINRAMGRPEPQEIQLTSDNNFQFRIQLPGANQVAYLVNDAFWILVGPAPDSGYAHFWTFERVEE
ncbi:hypothetical protein BDR04DRAFT_1104649 [Suillus decipiens]|nr:hypothetical protein BDR04DRAFT_1104649 [Suillus decipiens]